MNNQNQKKMIVLESLKTHKRKKNNYKRKNNTE